jgi:hypothetical protein
MPTIGSFITLGVILPIATAFLAFMQFRKDYQQHQTTARRALVLGAIIVLGVGGSFNGYYSAQRAENQRAQDRTEIGQLRQYAQKQEAETEKLSVRVSDSLAIIKTSSATIQALSTRNVIEAEAPRIETIPAWIAGRLPQHEFDAAANQYLREANKHSEESRLNVWPFGTSAPHDADAPNFFKKALPETVTSLSGAERYYLYFLVEKGGLIGPGSYTTPLRQRLDRDDFRIIGFEKMEEARRTLVEKKYIESPSTSLVVVRILEPYYSRIRASGKNLSPLPAAFQQSTPQ